MNLPQYTTTQSHEILMFVCLQKAAKQCCDVTKLGCTHRSGRRLRLRPKRWVQPSFVTSQHCLASFWRQTNIKISWDLATWVTNKHQTLSSDPSSIGGLLGGMGRPVVFLQPSLTDHLSTSRLSIQPIYVRAAILCLLKWLKCTPFQLNLIY